MVLAYVRENSLGKVGRTNLSVEQICFSEIAVSSHSRRLLLQTLDHFVHFILKALRSITKRVNLHLFHQSENCQNI